MCGDGAQRTVYYQGQQLGSRVFDRIQRVIDAHDGWSRAQIAREVCRRLGWRRPDGQLATSSCRLLLCRLDRRALIRLAPSKASPPRRVSAAAAGLEADDPASGWAPTDALPLDGPFEVRPIGRDELPRWRRLMDRYHPLGSGRLVGARLQYVALCGPTWVALLSWGAAALHNKPRDRFIGWDDATRKWRLAEVVNNARFLMLPWAPHKNLASRVLGANLRRLRHDWEAAFARPVRLAETFVDTSRHRGTCYRASNWIDVGQTRGFTRRGATYEPNGHPKAVFVYPLERHASERLRTPPQALVPAEERIAMAKVVKLDYSQIPVDGKGGLIEVLRKIPDFRARRGRRYAMVSLVAISVCATLAGARGIAGIAEWARDQSRRTLKRLGCRNGRPPSDTTVRRILAAVDIELINLRVGAWMVRRGVGPFRGIAIDGKTLRGSADGDAKPTHLVSAVRHEDGVVLAQVRVPDKTNEIKAVAPLLKDLDIRGAVVTGDAMLAQREIARYIVEEKGAHYLFTVKGNQPTLEQAIADLKLNAFPPSAPNDGAGARSTRGAADLDE